MLYIHVYVPKIVISLPFVGCFAHWCSTSTFVAIQKKHENEADTAAMLKIESEAVVHNDITKHLPQFSGFGLAFRSTMTMMEDEIDEKVHNHCNYSCFCYISVSHCCTTCFLVLQVRRFLRTLKSIKCTWPWYCIQSNLHWWFFVSNCTSWWNDDWYVVDNSTCKSCTDIMVCTIPYHHSKVLSSQRWCCAYMCCGDWTRRGLASAEFWPGQFR